MKLSAAPSNEDKLALYALFKQATDGVNNTPKPGMFDVVAKFKWQAWKDLGAMSQADAERAYIQKVKDLGAPMGGAGTAPAAAAGGGGAGASADSTTGDVLITTSGRVRTITLNRPDKKNAITFAMYGTLIKALEDAAADPAVVVTVVTGNGSFFCSGNDLSNFTNMPAGGPAELAESGRKLLHAYVNAWVTHPKILVAAVNGPAIGIAVTTLPLADAVVASHKATFHAPLTALGQSPEGTASVTFPQVMGQQRANELLLFGRKITATTAADWGLVSEVFEDGDFKAKTAERVAQIAALPPQSLLLSKQLMREKHLPALQAANTAECDLIKSRWLSDECMNAVMAFLTKGKGSK